MSLGRHLRSFAALSLQSCRIVDILATVQEYPVERGEDRAEEDKVLEQPLVHGWLLRRENMLQSQVHHQAADEVKRQLYLDGTEEGPLAILGLRRQPLGEEV